MNLNIKNLSVFLEDKQILKNVDLNIFTGKIHALMGPNGSGKSTLAGALMGNPNYHVFHGKKSDSKPSILLGKKNIVTLPPDARARLGLFLAFQSPVGVPGVSVSALLRTAYMIVKNPKKSNQKKAVHHPALSVMDINKLLFEAVKRFGIPKDFLSRSLNEDFSGGEKKKLEMLQAYILAPKFAIFDEIDTGLDVDSLRMVAQAVEDLKEKNSGVLLITHYLRILKYAKPDYVHILIKGRIVESGTYQLAKDVEKYGYKKWGNKII